MVTSDQPRQNNIVKIAIIIFIGLLVVIAVVFFKNQKPPIDTKDPQTTTPKAINVGVQINDSPGFNVLQDGQRSGFDIDLANYVAEGMGKHANFVPITVGSRDQQLKDGYVDMVISTYSITDAHIDNGIIFAGPYIRTEQGIMTLQDNDMITSVNDLAGQTVCVTAGSTSAIKLDELKKSVGLITTTRDTMTQCIADMKSPSTNVAAVTNDSIILQGHAHVDPTLKFLPGVVVPGTYEKYGIGIAKKNTALCRQAATLLKKFINTQWNSAFAANIQSDGATVASSLKPDPNSIDTESCRTNK